EGFLSDAYDHIDPEEYEVAFEEETGISYRDATEEEFDEWFITNVLCFEDLSEICKILRSLLEAKDLDKALENFNKKSDKGLLEAINLDETLEKFDKKSDKRLLEAIKNARVLEAVRLINENPNIAIAEDALEACEELLNSFYKKISSKKDGNDDSPYENILRHTGSAFGSLKPAAKKAANASSIAKLKVLLRTILKGENAGEVLKKSGFSKVLFGKKPATQNQLYCPMNNVELIFLVRYAQDRKKYLIAKVALDCINLIYLDSLYGAFECMERFDGIESWDVSHIKDFSRCFFCCSDMNVDLSKWNVSKGQNFYLMFGHCENFNCDISSWNMSKAKNIDSMFYLCKEFNQNIDAWKVSVEAVIKSKNIFKDSPLESNPPLWFKNAIDKINTPTGLEGILNLLNLNIEERRRKEEYSLFMIERLNKVLEVFNATNAEKKLNDTDLAKIYKAAINSEYETDNITFIPFELIESTAKLAKNPQKVLIGSKKEDYLKLALENGRPDIFKLLIEYGFDATKLLKSCSLLIDCWSKSIRHDYAFTACMQDKKALQKRDNERKELLRLFIQQGYTFGDLYDAAARYSSSVSGFIMHVIANKYFSDDELQIVLTGRYSDNEAMPFVFALALQVEDSKNRNLAWKSLCYAIFLDMHKGVKSPKYKDKDHQGLENLSFQEYIKEIIKRLADDNNVKIHFENLIEFMDLIEKIKDGQKIVVKNLILLNMFVCIEEVNLSLLDVSQLKNLSYLFDDSTRGDFSGIESWDVSNVKNFEFCFSKAERFNADISKWNVGKGCYFTSMFEKARCFNADISKWNMSNAKSVSYMFTCASSFDRCLESWDISASVSMDHMFWGTKIDSNRPKWYKH
ncbi:BspA family leucine-rich repeat surface protein, partial [Campylobacter jejuni]